MPRQRIDDARMAEAETSNGMASVKVENLSTLGGVKVHALGGDRLQGKLGIDVEQR